MGDGQRASNPWLQEFPDPITRVTWDNYITLSISDAKKLKLKNYNVANGALNSSYAKISANGKELITRYNPARSSLWNNWIIVWLW